MKCLYTVQTVHDVVCLVNGRILNQIVILKRCMKKANVLTLLEVKY